MTVFEEIFGGFTAKLLDHFIIARDFHYDIENLNHIFDNDTRLQSSLDILVKYELILHDPIFGYKINPEAKCFIKFVDSIIETAYESVGREDIANMLRRSKID